MNLASSPLASGMRKFVLKPGGHGFWVLGVLILTETRLRVSEARSALKECGASDFSYQ